jgi:hypothetical protein
VVRINAAARLNGLSYGRLINGLKAVGYAPSVVSTGSDHMTKRMNGYDLRSLCGEFNTRGARYLVGCWPGGRNASGSLR